MVEGSVSGGSSVVAGTGLGDPMGMEGKGEERVSWEDWTHVGALGRCTLSCLREGGTTPGVFTSHHA